VRFASGYQLKCVVVLFFSVAFFMGFTLRPQWMEGAVLVRTVTFAYSLPSSGAAEDAVTVILDIIGGAGGNPVAEICDTASNAMFGARSTFIGSVCLVLGQGAVLAYWFKYSTLGLAQPFYVDMVRKGGSFTYVRRCGCAGVGVCM